MAGGQEQKDIEKPMTSIGNNQQDHRTDLEEEWLLRKGKKRNFTVVFIIPKTFMKLSVHNKAELILYGRLKKEQFLGIQQKRHNQTGRSRFLAHKYLLGINVPQAIKIKVLVEAVWI